MTTLTTRDALTKALKGHHRDAFSQDSGSHCVCGSDSRFEQRNGDHPWESMEEHRADMLLASGAVIDADTLPDDEALVARVARDINAVDNEALERTNFDQLCATYDEQAGAALRALAAALSEREAAA